MEANRRWSLYFWAGRGPWAFPWRRDPFWPSFMPPAYAFPDLSRLELIQDLTTFCLRAKGYRLLPLPAKEPDPARKDERPLRTGADDPPSVSPVTSM